MLSLGNKLTLTTQPIYKFVNKYSIDFDGVDDYIRISDADSLDEVTTNNFSVSCWVKTTATDGSICIKRDSGTGFELGISSGKVSWYLNDGSGYADTNDTSTINDGEWHHIVWVFVRNDKAYRYIDGVNSGTNDSITSISGSLANSIDLGIGARLKTTPDNFYTGKIDELAIYDRELTQAEITRMYNTYYSPNRVANGNFAQIGNEEVTNGDFSQEGSEILSQPVDLQTDFVVNSGGVIVDTDTFTTSGGTFDGIKKSGFLTVGKTYKLTIDGNTTSSGFTIGYLVSGNEYGSGFGTHYFTASTSDLWIRQSTSGTTNITSFSIKEVGQDWGVYTSGTSTVTFEEGAVLNIDGSNSNVGVYQENVFANGTNYKIVVNMKATASFDAEILESQGASTVNTIGNVSLTTSYQEFTFYYQGTGTNDLFIHRLSSASGANQKIYIKSASIKEVGQHWIFANGAIVSNDSLSLPASSSLVSAVTNVGTQYAKTFKLTYTIISNDTTGGDFRAGGLSGASILPSLVNLTSTVGTHSISFTSPSSNKSVLDLYLTSANTSGTLVLDNIVLQELKHDATNLMLNHSEYQSANPLITSTKSMEFDGVDDYLTVSDNSSLDFAAGFSVSFWVYPQAADANDRMICKGVTGTGEWMISFGAGQAVRVYTKDGDDVVKDFTSANTLTLNEWAMVTVVVNRTTNYLQVYKNGGNLSESSASWTSGWSNSAALTMGVNSSLAGDFDGRMTEVGIWNRELTSLEVASLYNQGMPTNLLVNRNNYQSGNPTVFNTKQVDFDGTDDKLVFNTPSAFSGLGLNSFDCTLSAWAKFDTIGQYEAIVCLGTFDLEIAPLNATDVGIWVDNAGLNNVTYTPTMGEWNHYVATKSGNTYSLYVDGVLIGSDTDSDNATIGTQSFIGNNGASNYFDGDISQVGIWNEALTADEISSLYNHGLPIDLTTDQAAYSSSSNLVGYWRMGSGTLDSYPLIADQTNATLGSELITNGTFSDTSNWTGQDGNISLSVVNGEGKVTMTGGSNYIHQTFNTISGKIYEGSFNFRAGDNATDGYLQLRSGSNSGSGLSTFFTEGDYASDVDWRSIKVSDGTGLFRFTADNSTTTVRLVSNKTSIPANAYWDNITIKEIGGNPAIMTNQTSSDIENGSPYANIVQDSDFPTGTTDWTISGGNADITNGLLNFTNAASYGTSISNSSSVVSGISYIVQYTISNYSSGSAQIRLGSQFGIERSANGTYTETIVSNGTLIRIYSSSANTTLSIDNVTVTEVNTGLQGYWKMGDGTNDEYPVIYDQTNPTLSAELVTNGDFASATGWTIEAVWTISDGAAHGNGASGSSQELKQTLLEIGSFYKFVYEIKNYVSGSVELINSGLGSSSANNIYTGYGVATSTELRFRGSSFNGDIDNVSVKKINGNAAQMTNMLEGNISNQYPLTKIRNYYRMGDGILDGYPIIQDQTSPNLAHIPTTNLFLQSEDFTSEWSTSDATITANSTISPDGTQNASTLTTTASGGTVQESLSISDGDVAFSLFVKKGSTNGVRLRIDAATDFNGYFDLTDGTIHSTTGNAKIEPLANDWYRISISASVTSFVKASVYTTDGTTNYDNGTVFIWGAQIEQQSQATAYIKSDGIAAVRKSSTTNLINYSEDFSQSYWQKNSITLESGQVAPDGTNTAYKVTGTINTSWIGVLSADTNQRSIYAKTVSGTGTVNLLGNNSGFTVTNEWQRFEYKPTSNTYNFAVDFRNGTNVTEVLIWGYQLEDQTQAETYAKTTGLPVTIDLFTENNYGTMTNMSASDIVEDTP